MTTFAELNVSDTFTFSHGSGRWVKTGPALALQWGGGGWDQKIDAATEVADVKTEAQLHQEYEAERAKERAEKAARNVEFRATAAKVAAALGLKLEPEKKDPDGGVPYSFWADLKGKGLHIILRTETYEVKRGRIQAYGVTEKKSSGHITFAADKSPEAMARAITGRLLPVYVPDRDKDAERVASERAYAAKEQATKDSLGLEFRDSREGRTAWTPDGEVEVYGESVKITLRDLDAKTARRILDVLADARAERAGG